MEFQSLPLIIRDIVRIIRGSVETQSETISDRQVEYWIHQYRALLLKQDMDKKKTPNPDYIQEIKGLHLTPVDVTEITDIPIGKYVLKTDLQLPKTIDCNFKSGFTYVGTAAGREIQYIPQTRSIWQQYKYYTNSDPVVYLKNRYLYVTNGDILEYIDVRGIFEIPTEVSQFVNPITGTPSYDVDTDKYPIPTNLLPVLKQMILKQELNIMTQSESDVTNDSANNTLNAGANRK
jgi:hypothetical protein